MSLATPIFESGDKCLLKVTPSGGSLTTLPCRDWTLTIKGNNKDVSNARDGRFRIPGLPDAEGSFKMPYDTANDPTLMANGGIQACAIIPAEFFKDATHFYGLTIIVDEIEPAVEFEGELMFPVKFSLQSGTVTYPVA